ncbi:hypothetical protein [Aquimarina sp. SS2-1]|uniref:hypothetical protein n=1 Tax=Aquimarina besae TaxID=3342247 RepID=UPI00366BC0E9
MIKKIQNLNKVKQIQRNEQKNITGGKLPLGGKVAVWCRCSDGKSWYVGSASVNNHAAIQSLGDQCTADGGNAWAEEF